MSRRRLLLGCILISLVVEGCVTSQPPHRAVQDVIEKVSTMKSVIILPPQVDVLHVEAGGIPEKMDEWTDEARTQLTDALVDSFRQRFDRVDVLPPATALQPEVQSNLEETEALFAVMDREIVGHTYGVTDANGNIHAPDLFEEDLNLFVYSLGREVQGLQNGADAFVLMRGTVVAKSTGRKAVEMAVSLLTGVVRPLAFLNVRGAVVNAKTGDVLWFNFAVTGNRPVTHRMLPAPVSQTEVRSAAAAADVVYQLFKDLPRR